MDSWFDITKITRITIKIAAAKTRQQQNKTKQHKTNKNKQTKKKNDSFICFFFSYFYKSSASIYHEVLLSVLNHIAGYAKTLKIIYDQGKIK